MKLVGAVYDETRVFLFFVIVPNYVNSEIDRTRLSVNRAIGSIFLSRTDSKQLPAHIHTHTPGRDFITTAYAYAHKQKYTTRPIENNNKIIIIINLQVSRYRYRRR